jgi:hypothetical protein
MFLAFLSYGDGPADDLGRQQVVRAHQVRHVRRFVLQFLTNLIAPLNQGGVV